MNRLYDGEVYKRPKRTFNMLYSEYLERVRCFWEIIRNHMVNEPHYIISVNLWEQLNCWEKLWDFSKNHPHLDTFIVDKRLKIWHWSSLQSCRPFDYKQLCWRCQRQIFSRLPTMKVSKCRCYTLKKKKSLTIILNNSILLSFYSNCYCNSPFLLNHNLFAEKVYVFSEYKRWTLIVAYFYDFIRFTFVTHTDTCCKVGLCQYHTKWKNYYAIHTYAFCCFCTVIFIMAQEIIWAQLISKQ